ncbi:hypothetical protein U0070_023867 [Myodes glareolus]|uniref:Uncharacterized protein n=1 Tax=Myodes glareolus TaxID=447135 RepID=A0AAW0HVT7_MYOGA
MDSGEAVHLQKEKRWHLHLKRTWEKLLLAACTFVAIEDSADVSIGSSWSTGLKAMLKFAVAPGANPIVGCFSPGASLTRSKQPSGSHSF